MTQCAFILAVLATVTLFSVSLAHASSPSTARNLASRSARVGAATTTASRAAPSFGKQIQPILQRHCVGCHRGAAPSGGLNLETHAALMRGGQRGVAVIPRQSARSRLVAMVEGREAPRMPPTGPGLSRAELSMLRRWINAGAAADPVGTKATPAAQARVAGIRPTRPVRGAIGSVAFSPDGGWLAVGSYRQVELWEMGRSGVQAFGRSGVQTAGTKGTSIPQQGQHPQHLNTRTPEPLNALSSPPIRLTGAAGPVNAVAFSPDGRLLAAAGGVPGQSGEIQLWEVKTRRLVRTLRGHRDALYGLAFSPDGRTLAAASYDYLVSLWPVQGGAPRMLKDHIDAVYAVAFSPDGQRVASASGDRTVKVWDAGSGQRLFTLSEPAAEQYAVAFSPRGGQIAAGGADKMVRVWNVTADGGTLARSGFAHDGAILRLLFTPDGQRLVTTGEDRLIKLWDTASLTEKRVLEPQPDWVPGISLAPDGARLAAGRHDGSLAFYHLPTGARLAQWTGALPTGPPETHPSARAARERSR